MILRFFALLTAFLLSSPPSAKAVEDQDFPDVGRYDGAEMTSYEFDDFGQYSLPTGAFTNSEQPTLQLEGEITSISYKLSGDLSHYEVFENHKSNLLGNNYTPLFECEAEACGGGKFRYGIEMIPRPYMQSGANNYHYLAAERQTETGSRHVSILVSEIAGAVWVQVFAVVSDSMEIRMVSADEMEAALSEKGHIALYGIQFDYDSAAIRPDSQETILEISKFLNANPELSILIVGHTDNQGAHEYNIDLSQRRAAAVRAELIQAYVADGARLSAHGVGFLAPVASNQSEDGRSQNRRVEIVLR